MVMGRAVIVNPTLAVAAPLPLPRVILAVYVPAFLGALEPRDVFPLL